MADENCLQLISNQAAEFIRGWAELGCADQAWKGRGGELVVAVFLESAYICASNFAGIDQIDPLPQGDL